MTIGEIKKRFLQMLGQPDDEARPTGSAAGAEGAENGKLKKKGVDDGKD